MDAWRDEDICVTVRAYPNPSKKHIETSCVAGITVDGQLRRLYPIPDRLLSEDNRFKKYDLVRVRVKRPKNDGRPESRQVDVGRPIPKIGAIGSNDGWRRRNEILEPFRAESIEQLRIDPDQVHVSRSLALIRPSSIDGFEIEPTGQADWSPADQLILSQQPLFHNRPYVSLEYIPYKFYYRFRCSSSGCRGHRMSVVDWEIQEAYRRWRRKYGNENWEEKFREKFEHTLPSLDLQFYVGTISAHPTTWLIIGLYYPPKPSQLEMPNRQVPLFS